MTTGEFTNSHRELLEKNGRPKIGIKPLARIAVPVQNIFSPAPTLNLDFEFLLLIFVTNVYYPHGWRAGTAYCAKTE
jgi:hypothetical protein